MADSAALLRMLEPAVRPVQAPGSAKGPGGRSGQSGAPHTPLEQRDFDSLLEEANQLAQSTDGPQTAQLDSATAASEANAAQTDEGGPTGALSPLDQLDRVENASLRRLIEQAHSASQTQTDQSQSET